MCVLWFCAGYPGNVMDDEITECPLDPSSESGACAAPSRVDAESQPEKMAGAAGVDAQTSKAPQLRTPRAVPNASRQSTVQILGFAAARPSLKDQSQGAQAQNRSHRSAVRPFFCCGSELSLVSLMDSVDLNAPGRGGGSRVVMCDGKQSLSDSEENSTDPLLPHSYSCTADLGAACGSGASIQTVCGTGKAGGGTLVRRVKRDEHKTKKRFWSLRFRRKLPGGLKFSEMRKPACSECGSKKCNASRVPPCNLVCEKGKACPCQKLSYQCAAAQVARRQGLVADRRASVAGMFPISGNEELLAGERSRDRTSGHSRARTSCSVESFIHRNNNVDEASLSQLSSHLQQLNQGSSMVELAFRDPFEEYRHFLEFHSDFVAQGLAEALIHTRIDFIHHLVPDLKKITSCSFYWGVIDRYEAERLLDKKREGTFLLRDSAQDDFLFSVSFRRYNRSLHARIEQWNHRFSFDVHDPAVYSADSVCGLIEHYKDSSRCLFFEPMLTDPLHRTFPFSLQHLARAAICNNLKRYDYISKLPLPMSMKSYLRYYHYKQKVCIRSFEEPCVWCVDWTGEWLYRITNGNAVLWWNCWIASFAGISSHTKCWSQADGNFCSRLLSSCLFEIYLLLCWQT